MFDHVTIRVSDKEASERFYDTVLAAIGVEKANSEDWLAEWDDFSLSPAGPDKPVALGLHIGCAAPSHLHMAFPAASNDAVDAFHAAGYADHGAPGGPSITAGTTAPTSSIRTATMWRS